MAGQALLCVDCPAEATVQVVTEQGVPCGTYCQACWDANTELADRIRALIKDADVTAQIAAIPAGEEKAALEAQRKAIAAMVCADADQVTGDPLPADQAAWVKTNCLAGGVSPASPYFTTNGN